MYTSHWWVCRCGVRFLCVTSGIVDTQLAGVCRCATTGCVWYVYSSVLCRWGLELVMCRYKDDVQWLWVVLVMFIGSIVWYMQCKCTQVIGGCVDVLYDCTISVWRVWNMSVSEHTRFLSVWMSYADGVWVSYVCTSTMHSGLGDVVVNEYARLFIYICIYICIYRYIYTYICI